MSKTQTADARMTAVMVITAEAQTSRNASTVSGNPKLSVAVRALRGIRGRFGIFSRGPRDLVLP